MNEQREKNNTKKKIITIIAIIIIIIILLLLRSCNKKPQDSINIGDKDGTSVQQEVINDNKSEKETESKETKQEETKKDDTIVSDDYLYYVNFLNIDGTVLQRTVYKKGELPSYRGAVPTYSDNVYYYTFLGWDKTISVVNSTQTYTAKYNKTIINSGTKETEDTTHICSHYTIQSDGSWLCSECDKLLDNTNDAYFTVLSNGQPTEIIKLTKTNVSPINGIKKENNNISYKNISAAQDVVIRTDGGKLIVNAPADTINHYGDVGYVDLQACAPHSYYEYGTPMVLDVSNGHVVLTKEAKVGKGIHFSKTGDNFGNGQIILTFEDGAAVPDFTRDEIGTSDLSVLVCTIQHGVESSAEKEYVWLVGDGTIENQNVVVIASTTAPETQSGNLSGFDANTSLLAEKIANIATLGDGEEVTAVTDKGLTAEEKAEVVDAVSHGFYVQLIKDGIVVETTTIVKISEEANDLNPRDFSEYTIKLLSNVDLSETTWLPLGNAAANAFSGCKLFDGNGYTISGITYKEGGTYTSSSGIKITPNGLIGYLGGSITFKDLNIDVNIDNATGSSCGAFIGAMATGDGQKDKTATFIFCNAYGSINCSDKSGGFVGNTYTDKTSANLADNSRYQDNCVVFENCNNYLNITGNNSKGARIGGFVGCMRNDISFTDCTNYGTITVIAETPELPYVAGGFVGYSGEVTDLEFSTLKFTRCSNEGKLDAKNIKDTNIKAALPFLGCTPNKFGGSSGTITGSDCLITHDNHTVVAIIVDGNYAKVDYVLKSNRTIKW